MPRYKYKCSQCNLEQIIHHLISESMKDCKLCDTENSMIKMLSSAAIKTNKISPPNREIGELTKEYIESNREILEKQKKEVKEKTYESP